MTGLPDDLRLAARALCRRPAFSLVAVLSLAAAVGASAAVFSVVDAVLLRALPFKDPGHLVALRSERPESSRHNEPASGLDFLDWRRHGSSFQGMAAFTWCEADVTVDTGARRLEGLCATADLFTVLGLEPASGRAFTAAEQQENQPVVLLSPALAAAVSGGSASQQESITFQGWRLQGAKPVAFSIVGELPADFRFLPTFAGYHIAHAGAGRTVDFILPLLPDRSQRGWRQYDVVARLRPGVSLQIAQSEMDALAASLAVEYPDSNDGWRVSLVPFHSYVIGEAASTGRLMAAGVGLVLLLGCSTLLILQVIRAASRGHEIATRLALGASRLHILRQSITESLILAALGGGLGVLAAGWGVAALAGYAPPDLAGLDRLRLDGRVLAFAASVAAGGSLLAACFVTWLGARPASSQRALRAFGGGRDSARLPYRLFAVESALLFVMLTSSGLLLESLLRALRVDPGFAAEKTLTMTVAVPAGASTWNEQAAFYQEAVDELSALPGVESASVVKGLPLSGLDFDFRIAIEGWPAVSRHDRAACQIHIVSPGYFRSAGIRLLEGRVFDEADDRGDVGYAPRVIVNRAMAAQYWPGVSAVGKRLTAAPDHPEAEWSQIIGVVADTKQAGLDADAPPTLYYPQSLFPQPAISLMVRTAGDPVAVIKPVTETVRALRPDALVSDVKTGWQLVDESTAGRRFIAWTLSSLGLVALALAVVGVGSAATYTVMLRSREIGLRRALGAQPSSIRRLLVGQGARIALRGLLVGVPGSLAAGFLLRSFLFETHWFVPSVHAAAALVVLATSVLATCASSRRAERIEPLDALKSE